MTRIVAGMARGRRLRVPPDVARPTSDRAREAVFSMLESLRGPSWAGASVLDLYAGSGALGLEALSRGATRVDLVEADRRACEVIEANAAVVAPEPEGVRVHRSMVDRWVHRPPPSVRYDIVFCDPPYDLAANEVHPTLSGLLTGGALAAGALVVVERAQRDAWRWPQGFEPLRERRYGEARIRIARV